MNTATHFAPAQASEYLSLRGFTVAESTLADWRSMGRGPAYSKIAGKIRYSSIALDDFLESRGLYQSRAVPAQADRLIRRSEVEHLTGLSRSELYRRVKDKTFPAQLDLGGGRSVAWRLSDVTAWMDSLSVRGAA